MSTPLAGPDRSQVATTERRIGRKPRKFRDEFESMPCPEKPFYNNDLWLAEGVGFEPSVHLRVPPGFIKFFQYLRDRENFDRRGLSTGLP